MHGCLIVCEGARARALSQDDLVGTAGEFAPGRAVQEACRRAAKRSRTDRVRAAGVAAFEAWCDERAVDINQEFQVPSATDKFHVVWKEVRGDYMAVALVMFRFWVHLMDAFRASGASVDGFCAQCDYTYKVVVNGYMLGVFGFPTYRRCNRPGASEKDRRWRKHMLPGIFMLNPNEDSDHYHIGFRWARAVLRCMLVSNGFEIPRTLLPQAIARVAIVV